MTIPDPVRHHAQDRPDAPALVTGTETWSWAEMDARVEAAALRLAAEPARVAVRAETSPAFVVLVLAALRAGKTLVPVSTRWTAGAVADVLDRLGISRLWTDGGAVPGVEAAPLAALVGEAEPSQNLPPAAPTTSPLPPGEGQGEGPPPAPPRPVSAARLSLDAPFTVVHTSGSTGPPKAVLHSVGNHVWSARGVIAALDLGPGDRWLLDLPLYHVGGLGVVVRCALAGASLAVGSRAAPLAERVRQLQPTHASFVATQLRRLLDADADPSGLRAVLLGGSAIPADLFDRAVARGVPVVTSYGMTEMTSTVTSTPLGATRDDLGTSGRALSHRLLRISQTGEIEVSGPARFVGTLRPGGLVPADEWHRTGDLGRLDAQGRLVVTGRLDFQFVSGGENVQPEVIEAALLSLAAVAEAVVVPVPDAEFQNRPVAFVRPCGPLDPAALADALRQRLPGFMVPAAFYAWAGAEGMKPDRPALTREAERRAATSEGGSPQIPDPRPLTPS